MELIIGGAYQGKLDYAKKTFALTEREIFTCEGTEIDFSRRCIDRLEEFCLACVREEVDPTAYFRAHAGEWRGSILICREIFSGVVPLDAELRRWRRTAGELCRYLAGEAQSVHRIFCGLEQRLK